MDTECLRSHTCYGGETVGLVRGAVTRGGMSATFTIVRRNYLDVLAIMLRISREMSV